MRKPEMPTTLEWQMVYVLHHGSLPSLNHSDVKIKKEGDYDTAQNQTKKGFKEISNLVHH